MGKRTIEQEYETTETVEEVVEAEVPVTETETAEIYFCDDCGDPHDKDDLTTYDEHTPGLAGESATLHFCATCEDRLRSDNAALSGVDITEPVAEKVTSSLVWRVLSHWAFWAVGLTTLSSLLGEAGHEQMALFLGGVATAIWIIELYIPVVAKKLPEDRVFGRLWK